MSIFGGKKKSAGVTPSYTGLQIQTATNALPVPIVWGTNKLAPNLVWYGDFTTTPQRSSAGGKGGSSKSVTGYSYSAAVMMALCEGPIVGIGTVWKGQSITDIGTLGLSLLNGSTPQTPWAYLTTAHPDQALAYQGTAVLVAAGYDLGDSASIDNHNFEVEGVFAGSSPAGTTPGDESGTGSTSSGTDADPASIVSDFLTNAQYGVGFPGASINATTLFGQGGDASYQTYCKAVGLALSPALADSENAASILSRWLQLTNTAAVWSAGQLKFVPFGDSAVTGNGTTWNPNVAPVYNLTDDDFRLSGGDDPIKASRTDPYTCPNVLSVEILDRSNSYNAAPVQARDQAAIEAYGLRIGSTITAHEICSSAVGAVAVQLILQRGLYVRTHYAFRLSWEYSLLEPMDLVTLTDPGLGLTAVPVRIVEIEEDEDGLLTVTAEEFPLGAATAVLYPVQHARGTRVNRAVAAMPVNP